MNYFKSGRYNGKLEQAYNYDKKKKELMDEKAKQNKDNIEERHEEKKTAA